eukprot:TRINITY_DN19810_c0_g1_i1.p1 TRINITY_DN19810_c0_g1~~TRINITY_DN19810_c0_g1_i1.p1  ORF type:complete len:812 (+),score=67.60 TRINITY_DN19810_c0_g1_i1:90-2525(+)
MENDGRSFQEDKAAFNESSVVAPSNLTSGTCTHEVNVFDYEDVTVTKESHQHLHELIQDSDLRDLMHTAEPLRPIMIIPGFCSSGMKIEQSTLMPQWVGERVWLNLSKLGFSVYSLSSFLRSLSKPNRCGCCRRRKCFKEEKEKEEYAKNVWVQHVELQLNPADNRTWDDPEGIRVRVFENNPSRHGLEAVDFLAPGIFTNEASYVFGPLISVMRKVGYVEGFDLAAAPYDFRLPPEQLEERDAYFTETQKRLTEMVSKNDGRKVILLAHSMGVKVAQYFLHWAEKTAGRDWIDQHIELLFGVGGPILGAPKTLRGVVASEKMGLEFFLDEAQALKLNRGCGSIPWLFPGSPQAVLRTESSDPVGKLTAGGYAILNMRTDNALTEYSPVSPHHLFHLSGISHLWRSMQTNFGEDVLSSEALVGPPPVKRILHCYGFGLKTEVCYFFERSNLRRGANASIYGRDGGPTYATDELAVCNDVYMEDGIGYEIEEMEVNRSENELEAAGAESCLLYGVHHCGHAGDGTVPYHSLAYSKQWTGKNGIEENTVLELEGAEHRAIIRDPRFLVALIRESCMESARSGTKSGDPPVGFLSVKVIKAWAKPGQSTEEKRWSFQNAADSASHISSVAKNDSDDRSLVEQKNCIRRQNLWREWKRNEDIPRLRVQLQLGRQRWLSPSEEADDSGEVNWNVGHVHFRAYDLHQRLRIRIFHEKYEVLHTMCCARRAASKATVVNKVGSSSWSNEQALFEEMLALDQIEIAGFANATNKSDDGETPLTLQQDFELHCLPGAFNDTSCGVTLELMWGADLPQDKE